MTASHHKLVDRAWFVAHLVRLAPIVGLSGWDEVKRTLQKMLWIEKVLADRRKTLWDEVEIMRGVLSENCNLERLILSISRKGIAVFGT